MPAFRETAFWLPEVAPGELILSAVPGFFESPANVDLAALGLVAERQAQKGRAFVLAEEDGNFHGWLQEPMEEGMQCPAIVLPIDRDFPLRHAMAGRFYRRLSGPRAGALPRHLQLTMQRRARLALLLRVLDACAGGAKPRGIAIEFLDPAAASISSLEWKSSALRRKAKRLIKEALILRDGGYLKLLRGIWPLSES